MDFFNDDPPKIINFKVESFWAFLNKTHQYVDCPTISSAVSCVTDESMSFLIVPSLINNIDDTYYEEDESSTHTDTKSFPDMLFLKKDFSSLSGYAHPLTQTWKFIIYLPSCESDHLVTPTTIDRLETYELSGSIMVDIETKKILSAHISDKNNNFDHPIENAFKLFFDMV